MSIGEVIKKKREEIGISKTKLAERVCVSPTVIWCWENEKYSPSGEKLLVVMQVLGLTNEDFQVTNKKEDQPCTN